MLSLPSEIQFSVVLNTIHCNVRIVTSCTCVVCRAVCIYFWMTNEYNEEIQSMLLWLCAQCSALVIAQPPVEGNILTTGKSYRCLYLPGTSFYHSSLSGWWWSERREIHWTWEPHSLAWPLLPQGQTIREHHHQPCHLSSNQVQWTLL